MRISAKSRREVGRKTESRKIYSGVSMGWGVSCLRMGRGRSRI